MIEEELRELRRQIPKLNRDEKNNLLEFLKGDVSSFKTGWEMIKKYLEVYPKEKHFKRKAHALKTKFNNGQRIKWNATYTTANWKILPKKKI